MEIGEYVKVKEWNVIGKILKVTQRKVYIDNLGFGLSFEQIQKHSKNIIDLIEVGDYVNGSYIVDMLVNIENGNKLLICGRADSEKEQTTTGYSEREDLMFIFEKEIKSIVTHEQFTSMEYKVGE